MPDRDYDVLREHEGDRFYKAGESRTLDDASAKHLVTLGVLSPRGEKSEAAAPLNKEEGDAPQNKIDLDSMTVADLKDHAEKSGIDLGDATKKADIIAAIQLSDETKS